MREKITSRQIHRMRQMITSTISAIILQMLQALNAESPRRAYACVTVLPSIGYSGLKSEGNSFTFYLEFFGQVEQKSNNFQPAKTKQIQQHNFVKMILQFSVALNQFPQRCCNGNQQALSGAHILIILALENERITVTISNSLSPLSGKRKWLTGKVQG